MHPGRSNVPWTFTEGSVLTFWWTCIDSPSSFSLSFQLMALSSWPKKKMMMFMMLTLVICWSASYFSQCWSTLFNQNNLAHTQSHFQERWIQWNIKTNPNINSAKKIGLLGKNHKKIYSEIKHLSATFLVKCSIVLQCNAWRMTAWRHSKSGLISLVLVP